MIQPLHATLLGIVEGLTEFLPVSSTGHLILASRLLDLHGESVKTFEVVIQAGALGAVLGLYRARVASMGRGLVGQDAAGGKLLVHLLLSFLPAAIAGVLLHRAIKGWLFNTWPVVAALALGGLLMVGLDRWVRPTSGTSVRTLDSITIREALLIGCAQCLSLWPGTSRAMVTIVAGLVLGLPATAAAEYSFLLALPTLGAATLFDIAIGARALLQDVGVLSVACGFLAAAAVAALAIRGFIQYLTRWGLAPFGWYRIGLAAMVWVVTPRP
jgi:undecaprenyl-diphosphatase